MEEIEICLNLPGNHVRLVRLSSSASILDLKRVGLDQLHRISQASRNIDIKRTAVVFAGVLLRDSQIIKDCLIRDATVVHFVLREQAEDDGPFTEPIRVEKAMEMQCAFYGYCKTPCSNVVPLQLRFRCEKCSGSGFVVDPKHHEENWTTIWRRKVVTGKCFGDCPGSTAQIVFKCASHASAVVSGTICYLSQVVLNQNSDSCLTCGEIRSPCVTFNCDPLHLICLDCFKEYALVLLRDRAFQWKRSVGLTMNCPTGCLAGCIFDPHHFYVMGEVQYEKFKETAAEDNFFMDGGYFCPHPGCDAAFVVEFIVDCDNPTVHCPKGHKICRTCREVDHDGTCDVVLTRRLAQDDHSSSSVIFEELRSKETIAHTTKNCPGCRTAVERSGGCMHMSCPRCRTEFCWICVKAWGLDCMTLHWYA